MIKTASQIIKENEEAFLSAFADEGAVELYDIIYRDASESILFAYFKRGVDGVFYGSVSYADFDKWCGLDK